MNWAFQLDAIWIFERVVFFGLSGDNFYRGQNTLNSAVEQDTFNMLPKHTLVCCGGLTLADWQVLTKLLCHSSSSAAKGKKVWWKAHELR